MSRAEVQECFDKQVFGFIFNGVQREISSARLGQGGGNLLAALGLLCYTEFMGSLKTGKRRSVTSKSNFDSFFNSMGPQYEVFNKPKGAVDVMSFGVAWLMNT
jgi:hypothetical protein